MQCLNSKEVKEVCFNLLLQFKSICDLLGLRYSLGGGTLLGAIRHKGFIPWDDDIDVMMPRPDYNKFLEYCHKNTVPFNLFCHEYNKNYFNLFAKITDKETIIIDEITSSNGLNMGVGIDIFPIDGLGNSKQEAIVTFEKTALFRELLVASKWKKFTFSKTHSWYVEPVRLILYILSRFISKNFLVNSIEAVNQGKCFNECTYAGCVCGSYREREILRQIVFREYKEASFESEDFKIIELYDEYLTSLYGDYMKLPPEEKRVSHHTFKAYRMSNYDVK